MCPECMSDDLKNIESKGTGTLYAFTEIRTKLPGIKTPYIMGLIELDEKPGRFLSRIEASYNALQIGQRIKVKYEHFKDFSVHTFLIE